MTRRELQMSFLAILLIVAFFGLPIGLIWLAPGAQPEIVLSWIGAIVWLSVKFSA